MMENSSDGPERNERNPDRAGIIAVVVILAVFALGHLTVIMLNGDEVPAQADTAIDTVPTTPPVPTEVQYVHQGTNVRAGRSTDTEVLTTLARGDSVRAPRTKQGLWALVWAGDGAGDALGYIYTPLLESERPPARRESQEQESQFNSDYYLGDAAYICEEYLEDRLRAPSTAEYPWNAFGTRARSFVTYEGEYTYRVRAHVDAENAFGAKVRTQFNCRVEYRGNYTFRLVDLSTW